MELHRSLELFTCKVEALLRGGGGPTGIADVEEFKEESRHLLDGFTSPEVNNSINLLDAANKKEILKSAIKLHNKSRNLVSHSHMELKNVLKAISAWAMILAAESKNKVLAVAIKILSKVGQEMIQYELPKSLILQCFSAATTTWQKSCTLMIQRELPALEIQDVSIAAFWAYCGKGSIMYEIDHNAVRTRPEFAAASALVLVLPSQLKLAFAEKAMQLGQSLVINSVESNIDAQHFLEMGLNTLDAVLLEPSAARCQSTEDGSDDENNVIPVQQTLQIQEMRSQIHLSLAFVHIQSSNHEKAWACINEIEKTYSFQKNTSAAISPHIVAYAKFVMHLADGDIADAEVALATLIQSPHSSCQIELGAIKQFCSKLQSNQKGSDSTNSIFRFFRMAAEKFDSYPENLQIRIAHLQCLLQLIEDATDQGSATYVNAVALAKSTIDDHLSKTLFMEQTYFDRVRDLIVERIRWYQAMRQWAPLLDWINILMPLLKTEKAEFERALSLSLMKIDTLLQMERCDEAYALAQEVHNLVANCRSLAMVFLAFLHTSQPMQRALDFFHGNTAENDAVFTQSLAVPSKSEMLSRFIICARVASRASKVPEARRSQAITLMLHEWISFYSSNDLWKTPIEAADGLIPNVNDNNSFDHRDGPALRFPCSTIVCEHLNRHLATVLCSSIPSAGSSRSTGTDATTATCDDLLVDAPVTDMIVEESALLPQEEKLSTPNRSLPLQNEQFVISGYPDCIFGSSGGPERKFSFHCSLPQLEKDLVRILEHLAMLLRQALAAELPASNIGTSSDFSWLSNLAWNLAMLLISSAANFDVETGRSNEPACGKLLLCARLLEVSASLSKAAKLASDESLDATTLYCVECLVRAISARVDACEYLLGTDVDVSVSAADDSSGGAKFPLQAASMKLTSDITQSAAVSLSSESTHSSSKPQRKSSDRYEVNLRTAEKCAVEAECLLQRQVDSSSLPSERVGVLQTQLLMLRVVILCQLGDGIACSKFVGDRQMDLILLSPAELKLVAEVAHSSAGISKDVVYQLLNNALQANKRFAVKCPSVVDEDAVVSSIYQQLIVMSSTRQQALEKVEEFEQLIRGKERGSFGTSDVDKIISTAYNYGVTLVDLEQPVLAERFVAKAISLTPHGSNLIQDWLPRMQDTYSHILRVKGENASSSRSPIHHMAALAAAGCDHSTTTAEKPSADSTVGGKRPSSTMGDAHHPLSSKHRTALAARDAILDIEALL